MEFHVLYDNRPQPDKLPPLMSELRSQGIEPSKIWEPILAKSVVESINVSFKQIIRYAKEKRLPEIAIAEDDLMFSCVGAWSYFLQNKPAHYSIYIGGNYLINEPEKYTTPHYKLNQYVGNQLIIVSEGYYDRFLSVPDNLHIDMAQKDMGEFYACFPMIALQRPGHSANAGRDVNYNSNLKPEWIYNGALHHISGHR